MKAKIKTLAVLTSLTQRQLQLTRGASKGNYLPVTLQFGDFAKRSFATFALTMGLSGSVADATTLLGDTVQYQVLSASSIPFRSGNAVVGADVEFIVDAAADIGFNDGMIAVDISDSSILFRGPTTPNTFRFGYETIRLFSLDFQPQAEIGSIATTVNLAEPLGLSVNFGPHEVILHLGNSLWVPGSGDSVRIDITPVPEPTTLSLLLLGIGFAGICRARRSSQRRHCH